MFCGRTGQTRTDTPFRASGPKPEAATNYATVPHDSIRSVPKGLARAQGVNLS
jgi:hypothetical protein